MFESFCGSCEARQNPGTSDARHVKAAACVCFSMNDNPAQPPLSHTNHDKCYFSDRCNSRERSMQGDVAVELPANVSFQTESDSLLAFFVIIGQLSPVAKVQPRNSFQSA